MNYTEEHIEQMPPDALRWNNKRPMQVKELEDADRARLRSNIRRRGNQANDNKHLRRR
jgi:hypothetical protein